MQDTMRTALLALACVGLVLTTAWDSDQPPDLSHCKSEGGSVNCASCGSGSLCRQVYERLSAYDNEVHKNSKCTDFPNEFAVLNIAV